MQKMQKLFHLYSSLWAWTEWGGGYKIFCGQEEGEGVFNIIIEIYEYFIHYW